MRATRAHLSLDEPASRSACCAASDAMVSSSLLSPLSMLSVRFESAPGAVESRALAASGGHGGLGGGGGARLLRAAWPAPYWVLASSCENSHLARAQPASPRRPPLFTNGRQRCLPRLSTATSAASGANSFS